MCESKIRGRRGVEGKAIDSDSRSKSIAVAGTEESNTEFI